MSARFDKLTEIGRDAFILRYDATQRDGTRADVRLLAPVLAAQIRHAPRFFATMERASQVRHPGLSPVIAWGGGGNEVFVAYARTGELLAAGTRRSAEIAVVGASLARALETAHAAGLTHGAVCPAEVRLDHGRAVLSGLGLYQALCDGGVEPAQAANVAQPAYLSPEQQRGETASERSDVYALGAVLYEMLTGKPPFGGRTTSYVMATVLSGDEPGPVTPESSVVQETTPEVDALLRAIERAPEDRWPTMAAFADALEAGSTGTPRRSGGQARRGGLGGLLARIWRRR